MASIGSVTCYKCGQDVAYLSSVRYPGYAVNSDEDVISVRVKPCEDCGKVDEVNKVELTYFKESGEFYCTGEMMASVEFYELIKLLKERQGLPGLAGGTWDGPILVVYMGVPHVIAEKCKQLHIDEETRRSIWLEGHEKGRKSHS